MKVKKPTWTLLELSDNYRRFEELVDEVASHRYDCSCNLCMEKFGLDKLIDCFSEDEMAGAVIADNQRLQMIVAEIEREMDKADLDFNFENKFEKDYFVLKSARQIVKAVGKNGNLEDEIKFWIEETSENTEHFIALSPLRPDKRSRLCK